MTSFLIRLAGTLFTVLVFVAIARAEEGFGIFKSADLGRSWVRSDTGMPIGSRINAFGASVDTLFAGTDSGVFISRDEGRNWEPAKIHAIAAGRIICFATLGRTVFAGTDKIGMLMSVDEGKTWTHCDAFPSKNVRCLLAHREKVYAGTDAEGVFVTSAGGETWLALKQEFPFHAQVFALAMADDKLFAGLYSKGLCTWNEQHQRWQKVGNVSPLALASIDGTLIAGHNPGGLYSSADLGVSWSKATSAMPYVLGELSSEAPVWELASNDEVLITGASEGIYYSEDRGLTWSRARTGLPDKSPGISFLFTRDFILAGTPLKLDHDEPSDAPKSASHGVSPMDDQLGRPGDR